MNISKAGAVLLADAYQVREGNPAPTEPMTISQSTQPDTGRHKERDCASSPRPFRVSIKDINHSPSQYQGPVRIRRVGWSGAYRAGL